MDSMFSWLGSPTLTNMTNETTQCVVPVIDTSKLNTTAVTSESSNPSSPNIDHGKAKGGSSNGTPATIPLVIDEMENQQRQGPRQQDTENNESPNDKQLQNVKSSTSDGSDANKMLVQTVVTVHSFLYMCAHNECVNECAASDRNVEVHETEHDDPHYFGNVVAADQKDPYQRYYAPPLGKGEAPGNQDPSRKQAGSKTRPANGTELAVPKTSRSMRKGPPPEFFIYRPRRAWPDGMIQILWKKVFEPSPPSAPIPALTDDNLPDGVAKYNAVLELTLDDFNTVQLQPRRPAKVKHQSMATGEEVIEVHPDSAKVFRIGSVTCYRIEPKAVLAAKTPSPLPAIEGPEAVIPDEFDNSLQDSFDSTSLASSKIEQSSEECAGNIASRTVTASEIVNMLAQNPFKRVTKKVNSQCSTIAKIAAKDHPLVAICSTFEDDDDSLEEASTEKVEWKNRRRHQWTPTGRVSSYVYIEDVHIVPEYRGTGLGLCLLQDACSRVADSCSWIVLPAEPGSKLEQYFGFLGFFPLPRTNKMKRAGFPHCLARWNASPFNPRLEEALPFVPFTTQQSKEQGLLL